MDRKPLVYVGIGLVLVAVVVSVLFVPVPPSLHNYVKGLLNGQASQETTKPTQ